MINPGTLKSPYDARFFVGEPCRRGHSLRYSATKACVECQSERNATYRAANRERERQRHAAYAVANPAKCRELSLAWKRANPERVAAAKAEWRKANAERESAANAARWAANKETLRKANIAWVKANPVANAANTARHSARKRNAPGRGVTAAEWESVLAGSLGLCAYCNERKPLAMEHIEPLAKGGEHDVDNIVAACKSCNSSKGTTPLLLWLARTAKRRAA